jgi:hypothetical protein
MKGFARIQVALLAALAATAVACSGNGGGGNPVRPDPPPPPPRATPISQAQVESIVRKVDQQVNQAIANAFSRIRFASHGDAPAFEARLVNVPISATAPCSGGGRVGVTGSMTGNDPTGTTFFLSLQMTVTLTDCREGGLVINGDPYLSTAGNFRSTASIFNGDLRSGGGYKFTGDVTGSCQQNITTTMSANGGRSSGSVTCSGNGWSNTQQVNLQF